MMLCCYAALLLCCYDAIGESGGVGCGGWVWWVGMGLDGLWVGVRRGGSRERCSEGSRAANLEAGGLGGGSKRWIWGIDLGDRIGKRRKLI